jgi:hypothetical protein
MTRIAITKKDGTETPYFWMEGEADRTCVRVYKETKEGIMRAKRVRFDATEKKFYRE